MNLYLLTQDVNNGMDTYDSMVVAAKDEEEAVNISIEKTIITGSWVSKEAINLVLLGKAISKIKSGIICSSYNAG